MDVQVGAPGRMPVWRQFVHPLKEVMLVVRVERRRVPAIMITDRYKALKIVRRHENVNVRTETCDRERQIRSQVSCTFEQHDSHRRVTRKRSKLGNFPSCKGYPMESPNPGAAEMSLQPTMQDRGVGGDLLQAPRMPRYASFINDRLPRLQAECGEHFRVSDHVVKATAGVGLLHGHK